MKSFSVAFAALLVSVLSLPIYAQCWSMDAPQQQNVSRPSSGRPHAAVLSEMAALLERRLDWAGKIHTPDTKRASVGVVGDDIYLGVELLSALEATHRGFIERSHINPVPSGVKLLIAHEYAHLFQFRVLSKKNISLSNPAPIDELQADILSAYILGSILESEDSRLTGRERAKRALGDAEEAMLVMSQIPNPVFNGLNISSTKAIHRSSLQLGFKAALENKFGPLKEAIQQKDVELYDWSREAAETIIKDRARGVAY